MIICMSYQRAEMVGYLEKFDFPEFRNILEGVLFMKRTVPTSGNS